MSEHSSAALPTSLFSVLGQLLGQSTSAVVGSEVIKKRKRPNNDGYKIESQDATTDYVDIEEDYKGKDKDESVMNRQKKRAKGDHVLSIPSVIEDTSVLMEEQEKSSIKIGTKEEEEEEEEGRGGGGGRVKHTMSSSISIPPPKHPLNPHAVYVTGIAYTTLVSDGLSSLFSSIFGPVKEARVATKDGKGRGFGYVLFQSPDSATACLKRYSVTSSSTTTTTTTTKTTTTTSKMEEEDEKDEKEKNAVLRLDGRVLQVQPCRRDLIDKWHVPALPSRPVLVNTATITSFKPRGFSRVQMKINTSATIATEVKAASVEAAPPIGAALTSSTVLASSASNEVEQVVDEVMQ
jgi:RNA recognition motif-containing protein